ncbi:ABC transporter ATP-binding protein [Congregibacter variabilis]|uniref:ABC transporter ATP-binding protein n=1 Tax=Congregibacter variabilis TaxID=3081200 RepID=A0ABZ0HZH1_9GAMM|nr:ABC transporter ATP-binding protein [Congregibacter sp. IMCC43200]
MIDVDLLTRYYGKTPAVQQVSFSIDERQIVGLLGHNGAGKTTVMKMLSGYLEPSSGSVHIGGKDLSSDAREIQRKLGYLPENLPIYPEMSIADYLDYAAHLKGLRTDEKRRAIRYSVDATELGGRYFDTIGQLSRGFKQRVGVAQAILGEPELLILDEPGNGLDPEQNEHMRQLVRELSSRATVILSTHIMQEVDALCERVLVLSNGKLALDSPLAALRESRELLLTASDEGINLPALLARLPQIAAVESLDTTDNKLTLSLALHEGTAMDTAAGNISRAVVESGAKLYSLTPQQRDLEQIFREAVQETGASHAA